MVRVRLAFGSLLGLALLLGCVPPVVPPEPQRLQQGLLAFLADGRTTREEVLLKLGTPLATFEGDRLWTYDFSWHPDGEWRRVGVTVQSPWHYGFRPGACSLVLVFNAQGVVVRHSLVVEPPPQVPAPVKADGASPAPGG
jgi:outer membrane protein assembly factor BamE (lipoprotein component of BamABCDE complex)